MWFIPDLFCFIKLYLKQKLFFKNFITKRTKTFPCNQILCSFLRMIKFSAFLMFIYIFYYLNYILNQCYHFYYSDFFFNLFTQHSFCKCFNKCFLSVFCIFVNSSYFCKQFIRYAILVAYIFIYCFFTFS